MREREPKNPSAEDDTSSPFGRLLVDPFGVSRRSSTINFGRKSRRSPGINYGSLFTIRSL